jgi:hypothetical protein
MADPTTFASSAVQGVRRFFEAMAGQDRDQAGADLFNDPFVSLARAP